MISDNIKKEIKTLWWFQLVILGVILLTWIQIGTNETQITQMQATLHKLNTSLNTKIKEGILTSQVSGVNNLHDFMREIGNHIIADHNANQSYTCYDYLQDLDLFLNTHKLNKTK